MGPGTWTHDYDTGKSTCSKHCSASNQPYSITIGTDQYEEWQAGEFIQNVLPELDSDQREFLISGTTPEEWKQLFSMED